MNPTKESSSFNAKKSKLSAFAISTNFAGSMYSSGGKASFAKIFTLFQ